MGNVGLTEPIAETQMNDEKTQTPAIARWRPAFLGAAFCCLALPTTINAKPRPMVNPDIDDMQQEWSYEAHTRTCGKQKRWLQWEQAIPFSTQWRYEMSDGRAIRDGQGLRGDGFHRGGG